MDIFQIALYGGLVVMAMLCIILLIWALHLERELKGRPSPKYYDVHLDSTDILSNDEIERVGRDADKDLRQAVAHSTDQLGALLTTTINELNTKAHDMVSSSLSHEFEKYNANLETLREDTIREFGSLQDNLDVQRKVLMGELEATVAKDREKRMDQFNTRINDVVASYLVEALDNGVDLGAQSGYIIRTLAEHKEDIKKDVLS